ncbi:DUF55-domain-containing protein [Rickenella mellea]|uniref:DUF55-domain-containing protein n=1 Tax=Rickenella mellea TaxID=50990 RepID=A0A4V3AZP8_9AGAM|nr:DUF55-domain-containing protein [Rickenella mellea]
MDQEMNTSYWLMKAEPDSRVVKGKDVKFSVDDFEAAKTTAWEGVRSHEAKNLMKSMKIGDKVLFYHSNCKNPGIAGFAEVSKEAFPDYTAWDESHPYYDAKTDETKPTWYMVELTFVSRTQHFVPLALMKRIATLPSSDPPTDIEYIGRDGVAAIKAMPLVTRGRLSVQRVDLAAWDIVSLLASRGGWDEKEIAKKPSTPRASKQNSDVKKKRKRAKKVDEGSDAEDASPKDDNEEESEFEDKPTPRKRRAGAEKLDDTAASRPTRKSRK